jgi:hypothetical protein
MTRWKVPPMWEGRTVAICASGPSMSADVVDQLRAAAVPTIVLNDTFRLAPWADMLYAADVMWWVRHEAEALKFEGLKVTAMPNQRFPDLLCLQRTGDQGYDPEPGNVRTGGNSGYQALHVAIQAKAARVLLCGYDMTAAAGAHWFGKHPAGLRNTDPGSYARWIPRFTALKGLGSTIVNCTPGSVLQAFPKADLAEALKG